MQKIIIDTNVIVAALIQRNYPHRILYDLFLEDLFLLCLSVELLSEYYDVLSRPKFSKFSDFSTRARILLADIASKSLYFAPSAKLDIIKDQDDNMILELADESRADFIVTGNTNDFTFPNYKRTKILTPKDYWEQYQP
ncbi:MAG: putative toxin-antitoxin system toxin component, PIN family [Niabella sp.]|nr:putative toxin-antitoxin system toxin component, PIN family [Niabella sp.]